MYPRLHQEDEYTQPITLGFLFSFLFHSNVWQYSGSVQFNSVQSLSRVWLFETPWTAASQASLSITNSRSLLKLTSIESVIPSNHLILCCSLLLLPSIFPSTRVSSMRQFFASGGQSIGVSASESVLPMNIRYRLLTKSRLGNCFLSEIDSLFSWRLYLSHV